MPAVDRPRAIIDAGQRLAVLGPPVRRGASSIGVEHHLIGRPEARRSIRSSGSRLDPQPKRSGQIVLPERCFILVRNPTPERQPFAHIQRKGEQAHQQSLLGLRGMTASDSETVS